MRIVLDTNVLVAALIARGVCHELFEHSFLHHEVVLSDSILAELRDVLIRKFEYSSAESTDAARLIKTRTIIVKPAVLSAPVCRDSEDDLIVGTAVAGSCKAIVTGDKDLLALGKFQEIRILRPTDFWQFELEFGS